MQKHFKREPVIRIIDANLNRAKEGLRVSEEIARFILNNRALTARFKNLRHALDGITLPPAAGKDLLTYSDLLKERESMQDVGRTISAKELDRASVQDIFFANMQRVKESIRVLEEFSKLTDKNAALKFKKIRYDVYEIEKSAACKISALPHSR